MYHEKRRASALARLGPPVAGDEQNKFLADEFEDISDPESREIYKDDGRSLLSSVYDDDVIMPSQSPTSHKSKHHSPERSRSRSREYVNAAKRKLKDYHDEKFRREKSKDTHVRAPQHRNDDQKRKRLTEHERIRDKNRRKRYHSRSESSSSLSSISSSSSWSSNSSSSSVSRSSRKKHRSPSPQLRSILKPGPAPLKSCLKKKGLAIPLEEPSIPGAQVTDYGHGQSAVSAPQDPWTESLPVSVVAPSFEVPQDIEDEDEFLYGDDGSSSRKQKNGFDAKAEEQAVQPSTSSDANLFQNEISSQVSDHKQDHHSKREKLKHYFESQQMKSQEYVQVSALTVEPQQAAAAVAPEPVQEKGNVLQEILQSIGFNFELSKKNQEKVQKKANQDTFSIKESSSFLAGGLDAIIQESAFGKQAAERQHTAPDSPPEHGFPERSQTAHQPSVSTLSYHAPVSQQPYTVSASSYQAFPPAASAYLPYPPNQPYGYVEPPLSWQGQTHQPVSQVQINQERPNITSVRIVESMEEAQKIYEGNTSSALKSISPSTQTAAPQAAPRVANQEAGALHKQKLVKKREGYLKQFRNLESEIISLKKQQGELMRKAQKQKDGHKDPIIQESTRLMEEIARQMKALQKNIEDNGKSLGLKDPLAGMRRFTKEQMAEVNPLNFFVSLTLVLVPSSFFHLPIDISFRFSFSVSQLL